MTGAELTRARKLMRLSIHQLGEALGFAGTRIQIKSRVHKLEAGQQRIPDDVAQRVMDMMGSTVR